MEDQFDSCWKCATPQGGSHTDAPGIPSGSDEGEMTERFDSEIARQRKWALEHPPRINMSISWLILCLSPFIIGAGMFMWFRDELRREGVDLGTACAVVLVQSLVWTLWRIFDYKYNMPNAAKCPQCGYAWDIPRSGHDWLKWKSCPGCGLKMM